MSEIKIETGVPLPGHISPEGGFAKYPFLKMQPGDSFFVPGKTPGDISGSIGLAKRRRPQFLYISRSAEKDGVKGVRVWCVGRQEQ